MKIKYNHRNKERTKTNFMMQLLQLFVDNLSLCFNIIITSLEGLLLSELITILKYQN